jgi:hypothetical protein
MRRLRLRLTEQVRFAGRKECRGIPLRLPRCAGLCAQTAYGHF